MSTTNEEVLGGDGALYVGEDKTIAMIPIVDENGDCVDITGWTVVFVLSLKDSSAALLTKSATVSGTYNANPVLNTQQAAVDLTAAETGALDPRTYRYSWKRDDSGSKGILARGPAIFEKANALP